MFLRQYYLGCFAHASYLLADEATGSAIVVAPQHDVQQYLTPSNRALLRKTWLLSVRQQLLVNWHPLLPDTSRTPMQQAGTTVLIVRIGLGGCMRHEKIAHRQASRRSTAPPKAPSNPPLLCHPSRPASKLANCAFACASSATEFPAGFSTPLRTQPSTPIT